LRAAIFYTHLYNPLDAHRIGRHLAPCSQCEAAIGDAVTMRIGNALDKHGTSKIGLDEYLTLDVKLGRKALASPSLAGQRDILIGTRQLTMS
jgi:hypothetical protein